MLLSSFTVALCVGGLLCNQADDTFITHTQDSVITELLPAINKHVLPNSITNHPAMATPWRGGLYDPADGNWPVSLGADGASYPYTPTLYDTDGDGAAEIFLTGENTFGLYGDGTFLPGWPTSEQQYAGYGTTGNLPGPSVADIDGDGESEILWTTRDWWAGSSRIWTFNAKNLDATDLPGFPQYAPDDYSNALWTPFVLGDTNGNGYLEAWGPHTLGNSGTTYRISAFDHLGGFIFTIDLNPSENILNLYFGDLDGDGTDEMFAVSWLSPSYWLHVFNADGSEKAGYPLELHTLSTGYLAFGPPIPADLDHDGDLELLLGHWDNDGFVEGYHHDGTLMDGYPIQIGTENQLFYLGLGDVTGDAEPELIVTLNHRPTIGLYQIYAIDLATKTPLPGWPYDIWSWPKGFPTVVDIDDDGIQEICVATDSGELLALAGDGSVVDGYPQFMNGISISGVAAGDIDGDGLFELVAATWDGWVYAWDTTGTALPERADWPMRGIDAQNTGVFGQDDDATPTLTMLGDCPGPARFKTSGMTPFGNVAYVYARGEGSIQIPPGNPCEGITLGLDHTTALAQVVVADEDGVAKFDVNLPADACGLIYIQAIDIESCSTTNTVHIN